MSAALYMASKPKLPEDKAIDEQLSNLGIDTKDLDYVFFTHMDCDRVSGIRLVKDAKKIMISEEEFKSVKKGDIRFILLTGDCGYQKESWESLRLPGPLSNKKQMIESLKWVRNMAHKENCVGVFTTHDPDIKSGVIEL